MVPCGPSFPGRVSRVTFGSGVWNAVRNGKSFMLAGDQGKGGCGAIELLLLSVTF
jgi:hypothetical protein